MQGQLKDKETNLQTLNSEKSQLQGALSVKKNELEQAGVKFSSYQKFVSDQLQNKKNNLEKLIQQTKNKLEENQVWLEAFLSAQKEVNKNSNNTFAQEQVEKARSILNKKLTEEEIQSLLKKQNKFAQLEKKLTDLQIYENKIEIVPKGSN